MLLKLKNVGILRRETALFGVAVVVAVVGRTGKSGASLDRLLKRLRACLYFRRHK